MSRVLSDVVRFELKGGDTFFFFFSGHNSQHLGFQFLNQGLNLGPLQWKHTVLTTGPLGKFQYPFFLKIL